MPPPRSKPWPGAKARVAANPGTCGTGRHSPGSSTDWTSCPPASWRSPTGAANYRPPNVPPPPTCPTTAPSPASADTTGPDRKERSVSQHDPAPPTDLDWDDPFEIDTTVAHA